MAIKDKFKNLSESLNSYRTEQPTPFSSNKKPFIDWWKSEELTVEAPKLEEFKMPEAPKYIPPTPVPIKEEPERKAGEKFINVIESIGKSVKETGGELAKGWVTGVVGTAAAVESILAIGAGKVGAEQWAERLKKISAKDQEAMKELSMNGIEIEDTRKFTEKMRDPKFVAQGIGQNLPNLLFSLGVALPAAVVGTPALVIGALGFGAAFTLEAGFAYNEAKEFGVNDEDANKVAAMVGVANGILEMLPIAKLLTRSGVGKTVKRKIVSAITRRVIHQAGLEASTESLQEIVSNAVATTYDENRDLLAGLPESAFFGGILGGGVSITADVITTPALKKGLALAIKSEVGMARLPDLRKRAKKLEDEIDDIEGEGGMAASENIELGQVRKQIREMEEKGEPEVEVVEAIPIELEPLAKEARREGLEPRVISDIFKKHDKAEDIADAISDEIFKRARKVDVVDMKKVKPPTDLLKKIEVKPGQKELDLVEAGYGETRLFEQIEKAKAPEKKGIKKFEDWVDKEFKRPEKLIKTIQEVEKEKVLVKPKKEVFPGTLEDQYKDFKQLKLRNLAEIEDVDQLKAVKKAKPERIDNILYSPDMTDDEVFNMFKERSLEERAKVAPRRPVERFKALGEAIKAEAVIQPPAKLPPRITEEAIEKEKMKVEKKAFNLGYKAGAKEMRADIINRLRVVQEDIRDIKKKIVVYIKLNLPMPARGKFLVAVRDAKTQKNLIKAFTRVDTEVEKLARKVAVKNLRKKINKIAESKQIAIDYKEKIQDLVEDIELVGHRQITIDRLNKLEDYIKRQVADGQDVLLPEKLWESLKILKRKPIDEMSLVEISNLTDDIENIEALGKTKLRVRKEIDGLEKEAILVQLVEDTRAIEKYPLLRATVGDKLTFGEKFKNVFPRLLNSVQRVDLAISPMDVIFDLLDGMQGYTGANYKLFKKKLDMKFGGYLGLKRKAMDTAWAKADELGLDERNFDRIGVHAAKAQEAGREKLINTGYTEKEVDSIVLSERELEFYRYMRDKLDKVKPFVAEVMKEVYNEPLGEAENYFSFMTDWKAMDEAEIYQRFGEQVEEYGMPTKNVELGFTKTRVDKKGKQKIRINAMDIYLRHMDDVAYMMHMAKDIKQLYEVANTDAYGEVAGDRGQKIVLEWLDLMARKGGGVGAGQMAVIDTLRRNVGVAILGFKLSSALIQPTALMDGAALIGNYAFKGAGNITSARWRQFLLDNSPELRERGIDDPAFLEFSDNKTLAQVQKSGYWMLQQLDLITAASITSGAYVKYLDEHNIQLDFNNPNKEAMNYAEKILRRTQASAFFKDVPMAISKGALTGNRSVDKAIFQFQNFILNRWSIVRHDMIRLGIMEKDIRKAGNIFFWITLANLSAVGIRRASKELIALLTGDDDPNKDSYTKDAIEEALTLIPFISQFVSVVTYGGEPVPIAQAFRDVFEEPAKMLTSKKATSKWRAFVGFVTAVGKVKGLPGMMQIEQIMKGMITGGGPKIPRGEAGLEGMDLSGIEELDLSGIEEIDLSGLEGLDLSGLEELEF